MSKVKWIQVSDLHFGDNSPYSKKSREALLDYIEKNCIQTDYIFVTGDIVYAKNLESNKKRKNAYAEAEKYLRKIYGMIWKDDLQCEKLYQRIFIVPGNHDLKRDTARTSCITGLTQNYTGENLGKIDDSYLVNTVSAMDFFIKFYFKLLNKSNLKKEIKNMHYVIETKYINVLHINTCIASCTDGDDGKLLIGFSLLNEAIEKINPDKPTIAIAHHNFECLNKNEQRELEILLKEKNILLYLCGHSHARESNIVLRYNQIKTLNTFTCGTLQSFIGTKEEIDTVFFEGELDLSSQDGVIRSHKWTLDNGWRDDTEFGHVQNHEGNYRTFTYSSCLKENSFPIILNSKGTSAKIVSNQSPERNIAFYQMNDRAEYSLSIYGIGITSVSKNTELFDKILNSGGTVKLCMINPNVFKMKNCSASSNINTNEECCDIEHSQFCIYAEHIDRYVRKEYYEDIQRSYRRIKEYIQQAKSLKGQFEVKLLNSFIPMSINIINEETEKAELIVEYNMPFSSKRLLLDLNVKEHNEYFLQIKEIFNNIWNMAEDFEKYDN